MNWVLAGRLAQEPGKPPLPRIGACVARVAWGLRCARMGTPPCSWLCVGKSATCGARLECEAMQSTAKPDSRRDAMPMIGLKQAAEITGKDQSTIHRAMK